MIFIVYAKNYAGDCYHMYNPNTGHGTETRDIMQLHHIYYGKPKDREEVVVYLHIALPFEPEDAEAREGVTLNSSEPKVICKVDEKELSTVHTRLGRVVKPLVLYMKEYSTDGVEVALSTMHQNYYIQLCKLNYKEMKNIEISAVGAGLGGGFDHTSELKVMKFKEVMNGPESKKWK